MAANRMRSLLERVKKEITPTGTTVKKTALAMVSRINREIAKKGYNAVAVAGGSVAKGTFLKDDFDVDIFVKFDLAYEDKDLSRLLSRILSPFKKKRVHGSRDYYQIDDGLHYEVIPVLDIRTPDQARNVTDMSPMHVRWVKDQIRRQKRLVLVDEIRLAKQFCKANRVYGAESFIGGFSGHVLDILVIHYKGFVPFLRAVSTLRKGTVIDPMDHHKGKAKKRLNEAKLASPIIVIDPILPDRNAAAALTDKKFLLFRQAARHFLKKPDRSFFLVKTLTLDEILGQAKGRQLILLEVKPLKGKVDVIGGKLLKVFEHIRKQLELHDFTMLEAEWQWDRKGNALFWYILPSRPLPEEKVWAGPLLRQKVHVAQFKKKHRTTFQRGGRLYAKVKRRHTDARSLISELIASAYVRSRVSRMSPV
ncbi:MAG: hypothetical protein GXP63_03380 [DPANN group archaeon]|nr:hypothetical protein [DPANN group archaeon]